jgi:F0F1-type ATP synthase beta subunit
MVPGQTYTFQLKCSNYILIPSTNTIQTDIGNNAPDFIQDLQVTSPFGIPIYNCQFTYSGDGSDVIMDVANSLITACQVGSSDNFVFVGAVPDTAQSIQVSIGNAAQKVSDTVGDAINKATQGAAKDVADAAQKVLTPIEVMVAIAVGLVVILILTAGKVGGVNVSEFGAKIGGK